MFKKYVQIYFLDLFHVSHQTMLSNLIFMTEHCLTHVIFQAQRKSWEFKKKSHHDEGKARSYHLQSTEHHLRW